MRSYRHLLPTIAIFAVGAVHGFIWNEIIRSSKTEVSRKIEELKPEELNSDGLIFFRTTPLTVTVHFIDKKDMPPEAAAYSYPTKDPCEIFIPTGMEIVISPKHKAGAWSLLHTERALLDLMAHELAHCYKGSWHENTLPVVSKKQ